MQTDDTFELDFIQLPPAGTDSPELEPELAEVAQIISAMVGDKPPARPPKNNRKSDPIPNRPKPTKPTRPEEITAEFIACPRCSYFAATYRVRHGQENWQNAIQKMENGWLRLNCGQNTRHALEDAYGCRLDTDFYHYEGRCPDCLRLFSYRETQEEETASQLLWVQVKRYA